ncbi:porin [Oleiphilus messinensis]|uniref:Porin n=1 Tax=Oleiphilus messinensis TaxID=141451 RepID=A0A1Y0I321_9GAMM|nr:porin [Oleiphilus messinensis]ARU54186.1 porin [Oleiphilus messinensis]
MLNRSSIDFSQACCKKKVRAPQIGDTHWHAYIPAAILHVFLILLAQSAFAGNGSVSGFGRLIGGYLDQADVNYKTYNNSLSFDTSLIGLQGIYQFSEYFDVTAQVIWTPDNNRDSGLEWLYTSIKPTHNLNLKLGKLRTPFFALSEVLDVGFAYPWITPPEEVYINFVFNTFEGLDVRYDFSYEDLSGGIEIYYGRNDDKIRLNNLTIDSEVKDLFGLITEFNLFQFQIRATYHSGNVDLMLNETQRLRSALRDAGFINSAKSLSPAAEVDYYQFSVHYETLDYFVRTEIVHFNTEAGIYQDITGYYLTGGLYIDTLTLHLTYSQRKDSLNRAFIGEIPIGVDSTFDALAQAYDTTLQAREKEDVNSVTLGVRWDASPNLALKADVKHIKSRKGNNTITFSSQQNSEFDGKAFLFLFALETVF